MPYYFIPWKTQHLIHQPGILPSSAVLTPSHLHARDNTEQEKGELYAGVYTDTGLSEAGKIRINSTREEIMHFFFFINSHKFRPREFLAKCKVSLLRTLKLHLLLQQSTWAITETIATVKFNTEPLPLPERRKNNYTGTVTGIFNLITHLLPLWGWERIPNH